MSKVRFKVPAIERPAAAPLLAGRAIAVISGQAVYADKDIPAHRHNVRGLLIASVLTGEDACIQIGATMRDISWSWSADQPIYLGNSGLLTTTRPSSGFQQQIGTSESTDEIFVAIGTPGDFNSVHAHIRESFTLGLTDITNQYVLLGQTPLESGSVQAWVDGAGFIHQAGNFEMDGTNPKKLKWAGLGLENLSVGDNLVVRYYKGVD